MRALIRKTAPELQETVKWGTPCYVGRGNVCSIMAFREHVNLAFFGEPRGRAGCVSFRVRGRAGCVSFRVRPRRLTPTARQELLEGTGKGLCHLKFRTPEETRRDGVAKLIREAAALSRDC